jgi:hypothetical protein
MKLTTIIIVTGTLTGLTLMGNLAFLLYHKSGEAGVQLSKADCIETCIRVLQTESLFPDYHRTVQKCNDVFAEVETCRLVK